ncbi:MAG: hypothetical protein J6X53_00630, partial [Abditibacteriota bacterium]|nr:hypothetical protein [Abditibacteriota bacterium]
KEAEHRPPVQRIEDGERVRCDADWDNDSSQSGRKKPEETEEKSRLRYRKKPSKLTDDSQSSRKKNRPFFGFGKNAASEPVKETSEKDRQNADFPPDTEPPDTKSPPEKKSAETGKVSSANAKAGKDSSAGDKSDNPPGAASQKRLSARIEQRQAVRRGQDRKAASPPTYHTLALPPAETDRPKQRQKPDRTTALDDGELWTRTRRGTDGTHAAEGRNSPGRGGNGVEQTSQRRRQRLRFEDEPMAPVPQPGDAGYTRSPPRRMERRTEDRDGVEPEKDARKPRLRFEDESPEATQEDTPEDSPEDSSKKADRPEADSGQAGQTEEADEETDEAATSPNADGNSGDALPAEASPGGGSGHHPEENTAKKTPPTKEDILVSKAEKRVDRANRKLEKARSKLPAKRRIKLTKNYDEFTGKIRHRLQFEKEYLPEGVSTVPLPLRGISGAANSARVTLLLKGHQKIREVARDNVGVEAVHKGELIAEQGVGRLLRWSHNRLRSRPYRAVRQAERALEREQVNLEWLRTLRDHPELQRKHALTKWAQKQ